MKNTPNMCFLFFHLFVLEQRITFMWFSRLRNKKKFNKLLDCQHFLHFVIFKPFLFWVNRKPTQTGFYCPFKVKCIQLLTSAFASLESIGLMYFVYLKVSFNGSSNCQKLCWGRKQKSHQLNVIICYGYKMYQALLIM